MPFGWFRNNGKGGKGKGRAAVSTAADRVVYDLRLLEIENQHAQGGASKQFKQWHPPPKGPQVLPAGAKNAGAGGGKAGLQKQQSTVVARRQGNAPAPRTSAMPALSNDSPRPRGGGGGGGGSDDGLLYRQGPRPDSVPQINMAAVMARKKKKK